MLLQPPDPVPPVDDTLGPIQWGTFPDWIAGVSGFLAFVAAVIAVIFAVKGFRLQNDQIKELQREKRADQAAKIAMWIDYSDPSESAYHIVNGSNLPIHTFVAWHYLEVFRVGIGKALTTVNPGVTTLSAGTSLAGKIPFVGFAFLDHANNAWVREGVDNITPVDNKFLDEIMHRIPGDSYATINLIDLVKKYKIN